MGITMSKKREATIGDCWEELTAQMKDDLVFIFQAYDGYSNLHLGSLALVTIENALKILRGAPFNSIYFTGIKDILQDCKRSIEHR